MNLLTNLCSIPWSLILSFLYEEKMKRGCGEAWFRIATLTSSIRRKYEKDILITRAFKNGFWPLRRTEETLLENTGLPRSLWIKYRMLDYKQYYARGLPPPADLPRNCLSFEWAPWLELRKLDLTLEKLDKAAADTILFPIVG